MTTQVFHGNFADPNSNVTPDDAQKGALYYQDGLGANVTNLWAWDVGNQEWVQQLLPVKKYVAVVSQTGTDSPVPNIVENTVGPITWTRDDVGLSIISSSGLFVVGRTLFLFSATVGNGTVLLATDSEIDLSLNTDDWTASVTILVFP